MSGLFGDRSPYEVIEGITLDRDRGEERRDRSPIGAYIAGVHWGIATAITQQIRELNARGTTEP